jgi:Uma2 family endonuclease
VLLYEPELHLGSAPDILVPDYAGWRRERLPEVPDAPALSLAPAWVCEILSPSTSASDRNVKMPVYAREGVAHLWLVDPDARTVEVFKLEGSRWIRLAIHQGAATIRAEPFDELPLDLAVIWQR